MQDKDKSNQEDIEAINRVLNGDKNAFAFIQKKYMGLVVAAIRKMVKVEEDVQDIAQETFIKAYNALHTYQTKYTFAAWLYKIASNNRIDFLRRKKVFHVSLNQSFGDGEEEEMEIEDSSYMPDINIMNTEKKAALEKAAQSLPPKYLEIMYLRHQQDMDYNQIAEKMNIPLGTVKAHLFRARKLMHEALKYQKYLFDK